MRNGARIKLGHYPLLSTEGDRLRSLLDFSPRASALDPCAGTGAALHQLTRGAEVEKFAVELDAEPPAAAAASGIATVHGKLFDTDSRVESFSFLYLNPPYDSEIGSMGNKGRHRPIPDALEQSVVIAIVVRTPHALAHAHQSLHLVSTAVVEAARDSLVIRAWLSQLRQIILKHYA